MKSVLRAYFVSKVMFAVAVNCVSASLLVRAPLVVVEPIAWTRFSVNPIELLPRRIMSPTAKLEAMFAQVF